MEALEQHLTEECTAIGQQVEHLGQTARDQVDVIQQQSGAVISRADELLHRLEEELEQLSQRTLDTMDDVLRDQVVRSLEAGSHRLNEALDTLGTAGGERRQPDGRGLREVLGPIEGILGIIEQIRPVVEIVRALG